MASATPDLRLPSRPQSITALWPVPNCTAWWQRYMGVNDLPRVTARQCTGRESNLRPLDHVYDTLTTTPPSHPTCCTAVQSFYHPKTGLSGFWSHLLEQSSTTRDICTVSRDTQTASQDISLSPVISGPGHLICYTAFSCGPCYNFCYLGHTKIPMMMLMMMMKQDL